MIGVFTAIGEVLKVGFNRWGQVKTAKHKAHLARIQATGKVQQIEAQHVASWEQTMAQNSRHSLKDEWFALLLSMPIVLYPIPFFRPYIQDMFQFMEGAPAWYQTAFLAAVFASYGIRFVPHIGGAIQRAISKGGEK